MTTLVIDVWAGTTGGGGVTPQSQGRGPNFPRGGPRMLDIIKCVLSIKEYSFLTLHYRKIRFGKNVWASPPPPPPLPTFSGGNFAFRNFFWGGGERKGVQLFEFTPNQISLGTSLIDVENSGNGTYFQKFSGWAPGGQPYGNIFAKRIEFL
jgi:hypothetical protein